MENVPRKRGGPWISVDVEADGPVPGFYSMTEIGAVLVRDMTKTFYGQLRPVSDIWIPEALAISGKSRDEVMAFPPAIETMERFDAWLKEHTNEAGYGVFASDNNGFDWMFYRWYAQLAAKTGWRCPFGHTSRNIADLIKGLAKNRHMKVSRFRKTAHTHHPVDDAMGNAEALIAVRDKYGYDIEF
jgi:hypothetical protein